MIVFDYNDIAAVAKTTDGTQYVGASYCGDKFAGRILGASIIIKESTFKITNCRLLGYSYPGLGNHPIFEAGEGCRIKEIYGL